jgi:hypothetical protein
VGLLAWGAYYAQLRHWVVVLFLVGVCARVTSELVEASLIMGQSTDCTTLGE